MTGYSLHFNGILLYRSSETLGPGVARWLWDRDEEDLNGDGQDGIRVLPG
jgi:hypothetical protein